MCSNANRTLSYSGRLTFRGTLEPCEASEVRPRAWIGRPGMYDVGKWELEVNMLERDEPSRIRRRYVQEGGAGVSVSVSDARGRI